MLLYGLGQGAIARLLQLLMALPPLVKLTQLAANLRIRQQMLSILAKALCHLGGIVL